LAQETLDGITTARKMEGLAQVCAGLTSQHKTQLAQGLLEPDCALSMGVGEQRKAFREDLAGTRALFAKEATHMKDEIHRTPAGRKVIERSGISTLHPRGAGPAIGTGSAARKCTQGERDLIGNLYARNVQVLVEKFWKNGHSVLLG
jgi:hypothetical protein